MPVQKPAPHKSLVGQALKNYRKSHGITQEQLAEDLGKDARTIRAWENEQPPKSTHALRRISDLLGIEPEHLGLTTSLYIPRTPEEIEEIIVHVWSLMDEVRVSEAFALIERLVQDLRPQIVTQDPRMLRSFAHVLQVAGYVNSMRVRTSEVFLAIDHYHEMESIARIINDQTLLNIALTYQGDMYRRLGNLSKAITYLEAARDSTPQADVAAKGNGIQLLARAYMRKNDLRSFERAMVES